MEVGGSVPALEMSVPAGAAARASWLVALASTALLGAAPCADSVSRGVLSDCSPAACNAAPLLFTFTSLKL